jgi:hypothetical protein
MKIMMQFLPTMMSQFIRYLPPFFILIPLLLFVAIASISHNSSTSSKNDNLSRDELLHKLSSKIGFHRWRKRRSNAGNKLRGERYISSWHKKQMDILCCMVQNLICSMAVAAAALSRTSSSLISLIGVAASTIFIIWSLWWFHQLEVKYFCQYTLGGDGYKQRIMSMLCVRRESLAVLSGFKRAQTMQIFIKGMDGRMISVKVSASGEDKVECMKEGIYQKTSVPPKEQRLFYLGKQLKNGLKLLDYNIHNFSTLHLVGSLLGGASSNSDESDDQTNPRQAKKARARRDDDSVDDAAGVDTADGNSNNNNGTNKEDDDASAYSYSGILSDQSSDYRNDDDDDDELLDDNSTANFDLSFLLSRDKNDGTVQNVITKLKEWIIDGDGDHDGLLSKGLLRIPLSEITNGDVWGMEGQPTQISSINHACVYYFVARRKVGRTTNGNLRLGFYVSEEGVSPEEDIAVIFDFDTATTDVLELLGSTLEEISKMDGIKIDGALEDITVEKARQMEQNGLSIFVRLILDSFTKNHFFDAAAAAAAAAAAESDGDEAKEEEAHEMENEVGTSWFSKYSFSNVGVIQGVFRALGLNNVESAVQKYFTGHVKDFDDNSAKHELWRDELLKWVIAADKEVKKEVDNFFGRLNEYEATYLREKGMEVFSMLSWPRANEKFDSAKVLMTKVILGVYDDYSNNPEEQVIGCHDGTRVRNAITRPPGTTSATLFDAGKYDDKDIEEGSQRLQKQVSKIENEGGVLLLDTQRVILEERKGTNMTDWLTDREWTLFFACFDVKVFRYMPANNDGKPRIIFVHRPLCYSFYSGPDPDDIHYTEKGYNSQSTRAKSAQFLLYAIRSIQGASAEDECNDSDTSSSDSAHSSDEAIEEDESESIWGNFLTAFAMRVFLIQNLHLCPMVATLVAKNMIYIYDNLFKGKYHGLFISKYGFNKQHMYANTYSMDSRPFEQSALEEERARRRRENIARHQNNAQE